MSTAKTAIPTYELYGEAHTGSLSGAVHVEAIHARAHAHEWTILAHRHTTLSQIFYIAKGGGSVGIDGQEHDLRAPSLIWLPAGCVHGFRFVAGADGAVVTAALDVVTSALQFAPEIASGLEAPTVAHLADASSIPAIAASLEGLALEASSPMPGARAATLHHLALLLIALARAASPSPPVKLSAARQITRSFRQLVEHNYRKGQSMADYARLLGISADRLHGAVKAVSGQTPGAIIHERLMSEARRALIYTSASVADIAYDLGFDDAAYFSRFFARRAGLPPSAFRAAAAKS